MARIRETRTGLQRLGGAIGVAAGAFAAAAIAAGRFGANVIRSIGRQIRIWAAEHSPHHQPTQAEIQQGAQYAYQGALAGAAINDPASVPPNANTEPPLGLALAEGYHTTVEFEVINPDTGESTTEYHVYNSENPPTREEIQNELDSLVHSGLTESGRPLDEDGEVGDFRVISTVQG